MVKGFNPCFNGSCTSTTRRHTHCSTTHWVSILVLMDHALQLVLHLLRNRLQIHVSILVLMDHALQQNSQTFKGNVVVCFNPCFNGSCTSTELPPHVTERDSSVSILVLMDHALQRRPTDDRPTSDFSVSILVLMDHALQLSNIGSNLASAFAVSILVLMDHALQRHLD